ncbi:hypothetical protein [Clostridium butyricum]
MSDKVYYGERNNYINEVKIDFDALLRLFRNSIDLLINDSIFLRQQDIIVRTKEEY